MGDITYWHHDDDHALQMLAIAFASKNLVPVIGSGFTVGCPTGGNRNVPSGKDFRDEMLATIFLQKQLGIQAQEKLKKKTFSEVADYYFNPEWVAEDTVRLKLKDAFQGVQLPGWKKDFLTNIEWPYLYTLNVDDAIEKHSSYIATLPYDGNLSVRAKEQPTVFKLHGDIEYEIRHDNSRLVFRKSDYLQALTTNKKMLEFLKLDLLNKNVVYIGCSLSDELDISFIIAQQNRENRKRTKNIIFLSERLDEIDEQEYLNVGINTVIMIDDGQYQQIYELLNRAYQASAQISNSLKEFSGTITEIGKDEQKNKDFLVQGVIEINSMLQKKYARVLPFYYATRNIEEKIHASLKINEITILTGSRVSGKTLTAYKVLSQYKDRAIYIIDSTNRISGKALHQLLGQKNSIIFFDSLSVSHEGLIVIDRLRKQLLSLGSRIIICSELNNGDTENILKRPSEKTGLVQIANTLTPKELDTLNKNAIATSLPTFTIGKYLLEKVYNVFTIIGEKTLISKLPQTKEFFKLLYVIAVRHQITGQEMHFAGLDSSTIAAVVDTHKPFVEFADITIGEQADHTNFKVITHASSWVVSVLREFFRVKGVDWCVDALMEMFALCYQGNKDLVTDLRKFDNINFVFASGEKGAGNLIINLYNRLEVFEGTEAEFYVQKAKAYYNMYHERDFDLALANRIVELDRALTWAKTAHQRTVERNIIHVKALICLRKAVENKTPSDDDLERAIESLLISINAEGNSAYIRNLLNGEIKGADYLKRLLKNIKHIYKNPILLSMRGKIQEIEAKIEMAQEN
jgi:SIR2-like domain